MNDGSEATELMQVNVSEIASLRAELSLAMSENQRLTKYVEDYEEENTTIKQERDCLLLAIKHYDLADMRDDEVAEILCMCANGIVPPYAKRATAEEFCPACDAGAGHCIGHQEDNDEIPF